MTKEEIVENTIKFLAEEFEVESGNIIPENNLQDTLDLDSLDYVDLVVVIDENLGFKPTREDFENVVTFQDFYDLAEKKCAEMSG